MNDEDPFGEASEEAMSGCPRIACFELELIVQDLRRLLADPIDIVSTASDEICPSFLAYLIDHSVTPEALVKVVKVLSE